MRRQTRPLPLMAQDAPPRGSLWPQLHGQTSLINGTVAALQEEW